MKARKVNYINIPEKIAADLEIPVGAKLLYGLILGLTHMTGNAWLNNAHYAKILNVSTRTIKRYLSILVKNNYIYIESTAVNRKIYSSNIEKSNRYINIPDYILYNYNLSSVSKIIYGDIQSLSTKNSSTYASNQYFASRYGISDRTITRRIADLVDSEFISNSYTNTASGYTRRLSKTNKKLDVINIFEMINQGVVTINKGKSNQDKSDMNWDKSDMNRDTSVYPPGQKCNEPGQKCNEPGHQCLNNTKENNKVNTKENNKVNKKAGSSSISVKGLSESLASLGGDFGVSPLGSSLGLVSSKVSGADLDLPLEPPVESPLVSSSQVSSSSLVPALATDIGIDMHSVTSSAENEQSAQSGFKYELKQLLGDNMYAAEIYNYYDKYLTDSIDIDMHQDLKRIKYLYNNLSLDTLIQSTVLFKKMCDKKNIKKRTFTYFYNYAKKIVSKTTDKDIKVVQPVPDKGSGTCIGIRIVDGEVIYNSITGARNDGNDNGGIYKKVNKLSYNSFIEEETDLVYN